MTDTLTPEKLEELKALALAATPGPWLWDFDHNDGDGSIWTRQPHTGELARTASEDINGEFPAKANAAFIAAANPACVLGLISQAEAREGEIARLRAALIDLVSWFDGGPSEYGPWIIRAGEQGAGDAVEAARQALTREGGVS